MSHQSRSRAQSSIVRAAGCVLQQLESRRLLCAISHEHLPQAPQWSEAIEQQFASQQEGGPEAVSIVWTNRNTFSGADDNYFDDVFGTSRAAAQSVVDAALAAWSRVITSFNRADGTSTLQISITMNRDGMGNFVGGFGGAGGPASTAPADGKPRTGSITLNAGNLSAEPNDSNGYFLDTTPNDYSEFAGTILTPFAGERTSVVGSDLFSLVTSEITHCLGLISPKSTGGFAGYRLIDSGFTHNTGTPGIRDNAEGGGNFGHFYRFIGPTVSHALTSYNSGDQNSTSWGNAIHTAGGAANFSYAGVTYRGTEDDGNAAYNTERLLPSWVTAHILSDAYGYTIENPAKFGTMYSVLDSVTGAITVRGADNSSDTITVSRSGTTLSVSVDIQNDIPGTHALPGAGNAPAWVTEYHISQATQINIFPGSGDDIVRIDADLANLSVLVNGGLGNDKLQIMGGAGYDSFVSTSGSSISTTNATIAYSSMETLEIFTGDGNADVDLPFVNATSVRVTGGAAAQTINFSRLDIAAPAIIDLGGGSDVLNFATGAGVNPVRSPVTIFGGTGDDIINIAPSDFASTVITQPVTIFGDLGNDTLNLGSNNADSIAVNITFDGGASTGVTGDRIIFNDQAPSYNLNYDVQPTLVRRIGFNTYNVNYTGTEDITLNCGSGADTVLVRNGVTPILRAFGNAGNDNFIRGDGNITATSGAIFNGGAGNDTITFDDRLRTTNLIWDIKPNEVIYGGLVLFETTGFESVALRAGNGNDEITFFGNLFQQFDIDAGGGNDTIIIGFNGQAQFYAPATIKGGAGNDNYTWQNASNNWVTLLPGVSHYPVNLDGGSGFNTLAVADTTRTNGSYQIHPNRLYSSDGAPFPAGFDFTHSSMQSMSLSSSDAANVVYIYGTSVELDPGNQFTLVTNGGNDTVHVYPHDAAGNLTINGNIGIIGGAGTDSMTIQDAVSALPINYIFSNPFGAGTQNIFGLGTRGLGTAGVETLVVNAGSGNDTFSINQFKSGAGLTLHAGPGDDVCDFGNGDTAVNITSMASFLFNGEAGSDTFNLRNAGTTTTYTYTAATNTNIQASRTLPSAYNLSFEVWNTEHKAMHAGSAADTMNITSFASGELYFHGAGGDDTLNLPASSDLLGRRVSFFGGAGTLNRIVQASNTKTAPTILHVTQNSIGAYPGDSFFASGGSVYFDSIQSIQLRGGSGADTVYVQPNAVAAISIIGGNPTAAPGDTLNLALAAAQNYTITGTPASGSVTSSNLKTLSFGGFESGPNIDAVAPVVVLADININGIPALADASARRQSLDVQFSEDVSALISPAWLELMNLTSNQPIPATNIAVEYDTATNTAHFTFPGYPNGTLPDGNYQGKMLAGLPDFFGNGLPSDVTFDFFFLNGDANRDGRVNLADFNILAANFGQSPRDFTQGDFTYDGQVNLADFNILAGRFGVVLGSQLAQRDLKPTLFADELINDNTDALADLLT